MSRSESPTLAAIVISSVGMNAGGIIGWIQGDIVGDLAWVWALWPTIFTAGCILVGHMLEAYRRRKMGKTMIELIVQHEEQRGWR